MGSTLIASAIVFAVVVLAMAIGVIVSGRRLRGSCGGMANLRDERGRTLCEGCTAPSPECRGGA